jgi:hypothetical protein
MAKQIQILASAQINPVKWNYCLENSSNELIYANYHFLNQLCDNWSALIISDYETILPLPWRKKFGIKYFYAPAFIQQLGFFGNLVNLPIQEIWKTVNGFAKFGDLFLNNANSEILENITYIEKTNFIIDLNNNYPKIYSNYSNDLIKNLLKSKKHALKYSNGLSVERSIQEFKNQYQDRFHNYKDSDFLRIQEACLAFSKSGNCITRTVYSESNLEMLSTALLLKSKNRLYLLMNATNNQGRIMAANHYLLDQIIHEFSEELLLFDFEGSERKGIQTFYESFRPKNQPYFYIRINQLPYWINMIRKFAS